MAEDDRARQPLAAALAAFWSGGSGPSHSQLNNVLGWHGIAEEDASKAERVRDAILSVEESQLTSLAVELCGLLRPRIEAGYDEDARKVARLREALAPYGLAVAKDGKVDSSPALGVEPSELLTTPALRDHIRRIKTALQDNDAEQLLGSAKELLESASKLVLTELEQPIPDKFPALLSEALRSLGMHPKDAPDPTEGIGRDVRRILGGLQQIGLAVNDLRNDYGTGHGRGPEEVKLGLRHARLAAGAAAVLATAMIDTFEAPDAPWRQRPGPDG